MKGSMLGFFFKVRAYSGDLSASIQHWQNVIAVNLSHITTPAL